MTKDKDDPEKGNRLTTEDKRLWDFVTGSIKPLHSRPKPPAGEKKSKDKPAPPVPEKSRLASWLPTFGLKDPEPILSASDHAGLDRRTADRLRRGQIPIEARLDLHGMRQGEAQDAVTRFLLGSKDSDRRCVLVITGKGNRLSPGSESGVLRRMLPVWLSQAPLAPIILLYCPAKIPDGGDGAFYILLRRNR